MEDEAIHERAYGTQRGPDELLDASNPAKPTNGGTATATGTKDKTKNEGGESDELINTPMIRPPKQKGFKLNKICIPSSNDIELPGQIPRDSDEDEDGI